MVINSSFTMGYNPTINKTWLQNRRPDHHNVMAHSLKVTKPQIKVLKFDPQLYFKDGNQF